MSDIADLAAELRLAVVRLNRRLRQQHPTDDLTLTQISALSVVKREGPITAGELAAREQVRPPSMTRVIAALEAAGMLSRAGNPNDARQVVVQITDLGRSRLDELIRARELWLSEQISTLSEADRDVLHRASAILDDLAGR